MYNVFAISASRVIKSMNTFAGSLVWRACFTHLARTGSWRMSSWHGVAALLLAILKKLGLRQSQEGKLFDGGLSVFS